MPFRARLAGTSFDYEADHVLRFDAVMDEISAPSLTSRWVGSSRTILDRRSAARLEVDDLSINAPDLDDDFFALTGDRVDAKGMKS